MFSSLLQHQYHSKVDDQIDKSLLGMNQGIISKLMSVLEASLSKLGRYDEGSLIGSILSLTNVSGSGKELGQGYVNFTRNNMDQVRGKINDELWVLDIFEQWYTAQINMLCNWLSERLDHSLHLYQCTCLSHIVKVTDSILFYPPPVVPCHQHHHQCSFVSNPCVVYRTGVLSRALPLLLIVVTPTFIHPQQLSRIK